MLNNMPDDDYPRGDASPVSFIHAAPAAQRVKNGPVSWLKSLIRARPSNSNNLQEAINDYIDELKETDIDAASAEGQKALISNVLKTHDLRVSDVMIPRADIIAVEENASNQDLARLFKQDQYQYSRIPVYKGSLDHIIGVLHIKNLLACLLEGRECKLSDLVREAMIVGPGLPVMDLFLSMREGKKHMALVVDEHGGIDGLVTLNDVIEAVMGDIEDEFDHEEQPQVIEKPDGSLLIDARMEIEDFEERYGNFLDSDEREDIQTLGGLAFSLAGRVPKRGEILKHDSGLTLEVLDANASRVNRLRVRNLNRPVAVGDEV